MKKLRKEYLFFLIFVSSQLFSFPNSDSSFYPMAFNNKWEYSSNIDPHTDMIIDTLWLNEFKYFGFSRNASETEYWLRENNNRVYYLNLNDSSEFALFDFLIEIGDSIELPLGYECSFGRKVFLVSKTDTIITPIDTLYNCYHFKHQTYCMDAGIHDSWFVIGIGKIKYLADYYAGEAEFLLKDYSIITSVKEKINNEIVNSYKLFQNFPNPFNPTTKIIYSIPQDGNVKIYLYDILGREIATLANGYRQTGTYEITFNCKNLSNGIYFYKMISGNYSDTKKMILLE